MSKNRKHLKTTLKNQQKFMNLLILREQAEPKKFIGAKTALKSSDNNRLRHFSKSKEKRKTAKSLGYSHFIAIFLNRKMFKTNETVITWYLRTP